MFGYTGPWVSTDVIVIVLIGVPDAFFTGRLLAVDGLAGPGAVAVVSAAPVLAAVLAAVLVDVLVEPLVRATGSQHHQQCAAGQPLQEDAGPAPNAWSSFMTDLLLPWGYRPRCRGKRKDGLRARSCGSANRIWRITNCPWTERRAMVLT